MPENAKINPWSDLEDIIESEDSLRDETEAEEPILVPPKTSIRTEVEQVKRKHQIHTYVRHERRRDMFRCAHKYCYHMTDKVSLVGKANICRCGTEFILSRDDLRRKWPRCAACSNSKKNTQILRATDISKKIFDKLERSAELKQIALSDLSVRREED